jgi:hypothetical protein
VLFFLKKKKILKFDKLGLSITFRLVAQNSHFMQPPYISYSLGRNIKLANSLYFGIIFLYLQFIFIYILFKSTREYVGEF